MRTESGTNVRLLEQIELKMPDGVVKLITSTERDPTTHTKYEVTLTFDQSLDCPPHVRIALYQTFAAWITRNDQSAMIHGHAQRYSHQIEM
jgi:hypothetical protein